MYIALDVSNSFAYCQNSVEKTEQIVTNSDCGDTLTIHTIGRMGFIPATLVARGKIPCNENQFNLSGKAIQGEKERLIRILKKKVSCKKEDKTIGTPIVSSILYVASLIQGTKTPSHRRIVMVFSDLGDTEGEKSIDKKVLNMKLPNARYVFFNFLCLDAYQSGSCTYQRKIFWTQWFRKRGIKDVTILLPEQSDVNAIFPPPKKNQWL